MNDDVDALHRFADHFWFREVAAMNCRIKFIEKTGVAVWPSDGADRVAAGCGCFSNMSTDEAGRTGDQSLRGHQGSVEWANVVVFGVRVRFGKGRGLRCEIQVIELIGDSTFIARTQPSRMKQTNIFGLTKDAT